jgi:hypothetical protein
MTNWEDERGRLIPAQDPIIGDLRIEPGDEPRTFSVYVFDVTQNWRRSGTLTYGEIVHGVRQRMTFLGYDHDHTCEYYRPMH